MSLDIVGLKIVLFLGGLFLVYTGIISIKTKTADILGTGPSIKPGSLWIPYRMVGKQAKITGILWLILGVGLIILSVIYS